MSNELDDFYELLGDLRGELAEAGPNPPEFGDADMGMRQQFESAAPLAVLVESKAMAIAFIRRERDRLGKPAGRRQGRGGRRYLLGVSPD